MPRGLLLWTVTLGLGALLWLATAGSSSHPVYRLALILAILCWAAYVVRDPRAN